MGKQIGLFVGGVQILKPSVIPLIDTSPMVPGGPVAAPPPLMICVSDGGDPTKVYEFSSLTEAKTVLRGGRILSYLSRAFNPSPNKTNSPGASSIKVIRASSAACQGSLAITAPPANPPRWIGLHIQEG